LVFAGVEAVAMEVLQRRFLQWRFLPLLVKGIYGLLQLSSLHHSPWSSHVLLHEPEALISLAKACQLVVYDDFDFLLIILVLVISSFGFYVWILVVLLLLL
jgi:hypothetical protein